MRLERNTYVLICKESLTYGQGKMSQINIWLYSTKTNNLLETCTT